MDPTIVVMALIALGLGVEVGAILIFRTLTGLGPRPLKLLSFGASGVMLTLAMYLAHIGLNLKFVLLVLALAFLAQGWHVWEMCKRHWAEWKRRRKTRDRAS
jgi:hypothetical protein